MAFIEEFSKYTVELPMISRSHLCDDKLFEARAERVSSTLVLNLHAEVTPLLLGHFQVFGCRC